MRRGSSFWRGLAAGWRPVGLLVVASLCCLVLVRSAAAAPANDAFAAAQTLVGATGTVTGSNVVRDVVALAATASDPDGVERVAFLVNGTVVGVDDVAPFTLDWDSTSVADGDATIFARATDFSSAQATSSSRTVRVDNHPPDTTIVSSSTTQTSATFTFSATEPGSSFRCRLDAEAPAPCSSPVTYSSLLAGNHRFEVTAVDAAGNADASPAKHTWTITG